MLVRDPRLGYLDAVLAQVPAPCRRALDVGCGEGELARRLAARAESVVAVDRSAEMIRTARSLGGAPNVEFVEADFLEAKLAEAGFDFVAAVASLHHMPLAPALDVMRRLVRPGGLLVVHGLARNASLEDFARSGVALLSTPFLRARAAGDWRSPFAPMVSRMPLRDPERTYGEVRATAEQLLPGARFTRHWFFRYSVSWRRPVT
jgi:SAM-dependent methyltransferase